MWEVCFVHWNNRLVPVLFKPLSFLHSCSFHWNVFYYLSTLFFLYVDLWLQATTLAAEHGDGATGWRRAPLPGLRLLLGYRNYYAIHGSPYTSAHVLIENTLVQHKMAKSFRLALCCQNRVPKGTNQRYGLHSSASISGHSASVTVLGLLKKGEEGEERISTKRRFSRFQVSYLKHPNGSYKWLR